MEMPYTTREDPSMRFFETLNSLVLLSVFMSRDHRLGYLVYMHYYGNRTRCSHSVHCAWFRRLTNIELARRDAGMRELTGILGQLI